jgi:molybdenum cofactor cytidylyltransferase
MLSGIVLAAGESKRMGSPKALLRLGESTFLETVCSSLWGAGADEVIVVLGAVADMIKDTIALRRERIVVNENFQMGQLSSLQCGVRVTAPQSEAALVTLVDHPLVKQSTYRLLIEEWERVKGRIILAVYEGRGGHPVVFPRQVYKELLEAPCDIGARYVVRKDPGRVRRLECGDPGIMVDIDSPGDYEKFIPMQRRRRACPG